jgi:hypothetical protein
MLITWDEILWNKVPVFQKTLMVRGTNEFWKCHKSCIRNESIVGCNTLTHQIQDIHTGQHARILVSQTNFCSMFWQIILPKIFSQNASIIICFGFRINWNYKIMCFSNSFLLVYFWPWIMIETSSVNCSSAISTHRNQLKNM